METFYQKHLGIKWSYRNHQLEKLQRKVLKYNVRIPGVPGSGTNDDIKAFSIKLTTTAWNPGESRDKVTEAAQKLLGPELSAGTLKSSVAPLLPMCEIHGNST